MGGTLLAAEAGRPPGAGLTGVIAVLTGVLLFIGSIYMLLWAVLGRRRAYLVLMVSLSGWMILLSAIWVFGAPGTRPGEGATGTPPHWEVFLTGDPRASRFSGLLSAFPSSPWVEAGPKMGPVETSREVEAFLAVAKEKAAEALSERGKRVSPDALRAGPVRFAEAGRDILAAAEVAPPGGGTPLRVYGLWNPGSLLLPSWIALGASVLIFLSHLWLLARDEVREEEQARRVAAGAA